MLADFRPPYNATVIDKLAAADGVLLGKTNLDEFAMGGSTENSALASTRNPWDLAARSWGIQWWCGGLRRGLDGTAFDRHGYGRFDSSASRLLRRGGTQADLWPS